MYFIGIVFLVLNLGWSLHASDLYPSYSLVKDPTRVAEWSDNEALNYITTVRLSDYDHHIFQYRRYPCQFFYTDEIQLHYVNETRNQCIHNTTTDDYEYTFQLHFDSRHVEPYILRNIAIQCNYTNCSLSLLNLTYIHIGWSLKGRGQNPDCSFDLHQPYQIHRMPYTVSDWITLRCKSQPACSQSKLNVEQSLSSYVKLIYGSSYELEIPYCSLEKNLQHTLETNLAETNQLLKQLITLIQRNVESIDVHEENKTPLHHDNLQPTK